MPQAGDSFSIITYASFTNQFASVQVVGLPAGLVATPNYGSTSLDIMVGAGLVASEASPNLPSIAPLNAGNLQPIVDAAMIRLIDSGVPESYAQQVSAISWRIADLSGNLLGLAGNDTIWLDVDAAGHGWWIDSTPLDDDEFLNAWRVLTGRSAQPAGARS